MATASGKARCVTCGKEKSTVRCDGCSQPFCYNHLGEHRQELSRQLDEIQSTRDLFRQTLTDLTTKPEKHLLMKQIDQWERNSINVIRQTADDARQILTKYTNGQISQIEVKLNKLTEQLRESRDENDFFEKDLSQWKEELKKLKEELDKPANVAIKNTSTPLITKIFVDISAKTHVPNVSATARWYQNGITVAGGNGQGNALNQLDEAEGLYVDDDQTIYIADQYNHRIVEWKSGATSGQTVVGGKGQGTRNDQLNAPTNVIIDKENDSFIICDRGSKRVVRWARRNGTSGQTIISGVNCYGLTIDNNGYLYVSDYNNHEVRRWKTGETSGTLVAGGNGQGNGLDQLSGPTYIFVDDEYSVYVSDYNNHRVMKWIKDAKEGIIVAGGHNQGNRVTQLKYPCGIVVDRAGTIYVADCGNHRIMRWFAGAVQGNIVVGGNGQGIKANQLNRPWNLSFDRQGNLYVVDYSNHRVQKFNLDKNSSL